MNVAISAEEPRESEPLSAEVLAIIQKEESILSETLQSLRAQLSAREERLRNEERRARELTSELVAASRDEDKQALSSDEAVSHALRDAHGVQVQLIEKHIDRPYFARIVVEEEVNNRIKQIEYKLGFFTNLDCRIIDWRTAPIAKLYYEYKEGEQYSEVIQDRDRDGTVILKHRTDIEDGALKRLGCTEGDFIKEDGVWKAASGSRRTRSVRGKFPDVLSLISAEQFRAITEEATASVVIRGIAGSGKTTVALHRLSWLLHNNNSDIRRTHTEVLVRSPVLRDYIMRSLPDLQISEVHVSTYDDWSESVASRLLGQLGAAVRFAQSAEHPSIARLKNSLALVRAIDDYVRSQRARMVEYLEQKIPWSALPPECARAFQAARQQNLPSFSLVAAIESSLPRERTNETGETVRAEMARVRKRLESWRDDILNILAQPDAILAHDDSKLLDKEIIAQARQRTAELREQDCVDPSDLPLALLLFAEKGTLLPLRESLLGRYDHLVIDEVQDFSPVEIAAAISSVRNRASLTIAGDQNQELGSELRFPGWDRLRKHWKLENDISRVIDLDTSHRSTLPIIQFADHVSRRPITANGREGIKPLVYLCLSENSGVTEAIQWLQRVVSKFPSDIVAVLCATAEEARHVTTLLRPTLGSSVRNASQESFSFEEGILVVDINTVKGLEFPHVLLWNPTSKTFPDNPRSRNLLYVATSRAEEHLCVVSWGRISPLLPNLNSSLARFVVEEPEEPEEEDTWGTDRR